MRPYLGNTQMYQPALSGNAGPIIPSPFLMQSGGNTVQVLTPQELVQPMPDITQPPLIAVSASIGGSGGLISALILAGMYAYLKTTFKGVK